MKVYHLQIWFIIAHKSIFLCELIDKDYVWQYEYCILGLL